MNKRIETIKKKVAEAKAEQIRLQERVRALEQRKQELLDQFQKAEVDPKAVETVIQEEKEALAGAVKDLERRLGIV